ncbi:UNVERIFIED_CONTAM: hypothetical protein GTU68_058181 [Idotea baltica]|nr:hypothetical protein [Idotea baltica]
MLLLSRLVNLGLTLFVLIREVFPEEPV